MRMRILSKMMVIVMFLFAGIFAALAIFNPFNAESITSYINLAITFTSCAVIWVVAAHLERKLRPKPRKPKHSGKPDLSKLADITAEGLYEQSFTSKDDYTKPEEIWAASPKMEAEMYETLDKGALIAAENGHAQLKINFHVYGDIKKSHGIEIDISNAHEGKADVTCYNFMMPKPIWKKPQWAISSQDTAEAFERSMQQKTSEHFDRPYFEVEQTRFAWSTVTVHWMKQEDHESLKKAISIPGGYDAYKAGVPVDDIVA